MCVHADVSPPYCNCMLTIILQCKVRDQIYKVVNKMTHACRQCDIVTDIGY